MSSFIAFGVRLIGQPLNYSGIIAGHTSDIFGLRKQLPGLPLFSSLSSRPSTQPTTYRQVQPNVSRQPVAPPRARPKVVPNPTRTVATVVSGSSPNIYKTSPFSYLGSLNHFFATTRFRSEGPNRPIMISFAIYRPPCPILDQTLKPRGAVPSINPHAAATFLVFPIDPLLIPHPTTYPSSSRLLSSWRRCRRRPQPPGPRPVFPVDRSRACPHLASFSFSALSLSL